MKDNLKISKPNRLNRKLQLLKRRQTKLSRAGLRLDRRLSLRLRSLRPIRFQVLKIKNGRFVSHSLRIAGAAGTLRVARSRALLRYRGE